MQLYDDSAIFVLTELVELLTDALCSVAQSSYATGFIMRQTAGSDAFRAFGPKSSLYDCKLHILNYGLWADLPAQ